ncbi:uncharacterized protein L969DRAFT_44297 [Mixia osmundae IAM 14324]|uniref:RNA helicase n=1 Tax=Mixia osmundae (strain CBS 9802 / IAM 14324 / JCM 22182 / KY 12970) TaxID=764103 RepID=G7E3T6_MIXOS|nr:uncharacterized protein L969DRAFT_44297 [Mixia osmundae IAM 14324]KEI41941.1 hypothetical protein L969DRAFT_44297 [Mixia osmundae IAM 14324]GAA97496.1 hypothetical protein E5Q_04174 [Mixia osmundae IAM 14324]
MEIEALEKLSLVNSITQELVNHTGMNDKVLAEFLIDLHEQSSSLDAFRQALVDNGAEGLPDSFVTSMDRLVLRMHPKHKKPRAVQDTNGHSKSIETVDAVASTGDPAQDAERERKKRLFPGLAMPDTEWQPSFEPDMATDKASKSKTADLLGVDDLMSQLESEAKKRRTLPAIEEDETSNKRMRRDSRSPPMPDRSRRRSPDYTSSRNGDERGRSREDRRPILPSRDAMDDKPTLYKVYPGKVTGLKNFGAFVSLSNLRGRFEGLVHVGSIGVGRINDPADVLSRGQSVYVKVMSIAGNRIGLSMRDADQQSGSDLTPHLRIKSEAELAEEEASKYATGANGVLGSRGGQSKPPMQFDDNVRSSARRMTSPERWEIKQLIASGHAKRSDYPNLDDDFATPSSKPGEADADEEVEVEVREEEAPFLAGQTKRVLDLSPVKIVKAPDGTLNRAALSGASLAKERKELKQQEANDVDAETTNINQAWLDPAANPADRTFAQDMRGNALGRKEQQQPAWRAATKSLAFGKMTTMSMQQQRESLPIYKFKDKLIEAITENQVLVVVGDTGSGKTTQMTQYLAEAGFADRGKIGCTQPRRVAAVSVAKRVAEEVGCRVGQEVGYTIRFEDCTSPETRIKYMTDGMLQREALIDPDMSNYSVIMLDEAHERTIATDVLFGLLKKTLKRRKDLKLIVTSATLDAEKFARYFYNCDIFTIPGRTFPVEVLYTKEAESDYLDASLITVMQIHLSEPPGDILLFLTGQEEIDTSCEILFERMRALGPQVPELIILPIYSALPSEMQSRIFDPAPPGARKVVIATNIAETSITIDGIYYVVDPGMAKQNAYDPRLGMDSLVVTPISQAQARQRTGRAGRTGPGKCYRLYTEAAYRNEMLPNPVPEIQRQNLDHTILMLKAMGVNDLINFDFMDPPPQQTLVTALEQLYALSALDDEGLLTRLGRKMADFPMTPPLARMLIESVDLGCSEEALTIVAMLSIPSPFYRPKDKQAQADAKKAKFHQPEGDHLTLLMVYNGWKASKFSAPWCSDNFVQARSLKKAQDVRKQLVGIMDRYKYDLVSAGRQFHRVQRAICAGFFRNAAKKDPQEGYKTLVEGTPVFLHPSSSLFNRAPEWAVYHELVLTSKEYMREVTAIDPKWLVNAAPNFFRVADANKLSKRKRAEKVAPLFDRFAKEQDDWRISKVKRAVRTSQSFG